MEEGLGYLRGKMEIFMEEYERDRIETMQALGRVDTSLQALHDTTIALSGKVSSMQEKHTSDTARITEEEIVTLKLIHRARMIWEERAIKIVMIGIVLIALWGMANEIPAWRDKIGQELFKVLHG